MPLASLLTERREDTGQLHEQTGESVVIRSIPEHPVLKDLRVRQAINLSLDRKSMIDILYGPVAEHLNGMIVRRPRSLNPELKEYPYDPAKASG